MNPSIKPCAECQRPTRPSHLKIADYPGTIVRRNDLCDACARVSLPVMTPASRAKHEHIVAGLNSFLARRHERADMMARRENYERMLTA